MTMKIWRAVPISMLCLAGAAGYASAADDQQTPIATDRPSVTASSVVVPAGSLQAENGLTDTQDQGVHTFNAPETLLRFGIASRSELRLTLPNFVRNSGDDSESGAGDLLIGVKQQLLHAKNGDLSLVLSLSLPTGSDAISSHGYDPSVQLAWSRAIVAGWTAAGMFSLYGPTDGDHRNVTGETTFLLDRQVTAQWNAFAEYAGSFPEEGGARHLVNVGTAFKPTRQQQFDLRVGFGLSSSAADWLVGVGYSFRLDRVLRR